MYYRRTYFDIAQLTYEGCFVYDQVCILLARAGWSDTQIARDRWSIVDHISLPYPSSFPSRMAVVVADISRTLTPEKRCAALEGEVRGENERCRQVIASVSDADIRLRLGFFQVSFPVVLIFVFDRATVME